MVKCKAVMPKHSANAICKQLRGAGLSKEDSLQILNQIQKWYGCNGAEWTVDRLKGLHHWYISYKAGSPVIPAWFRHTKDGMPKGIFSKVFKMRNMQRALAVMSVHTALVAKQTLVTQAVKELKALAGSDHVQKGIGRRIAQAIRSSEYYPHVKRIFPVENRYHLGTWFSNMHCLHDDEGNSRSERMYGLSTLCAPNLSIITGDSIPCGKGKVVLSRAKDQSNAMADAYIRSMSSIPSATLTHMVLTGNDKFLPPAYDGLLSEMREALKGYRWHPVKELYQIGESLASRKFQFNNWLSPDDVCGHLSVIQQESLKARFVANTHRVSNFYLSQLADHWYDALSWVPTDCTFEQSSGVEYVQKELRAGHTLAGSDLSSATDLLDVEECMDLVQGVYYPGEYDRNFMLLSDPKDLGVPDSYQRKWEHNRLRKWYVTEASEHFLSIAKGGWYTHEKLLTAETANAESIVHWRSGQPLGSKPSFAMLGLTNNALGIAAALRYLEQLRNSGVTPSTEVVDEMLTGFRVQGDDIILRAELAPYYNDLVQSLGGEINLTKTITSARCAEFAGKVITPSQVALKRIKAKEINDFQFLEVVDRLGPQSVSMLRPMQRDAWETFKYVPGIAVPGPFAQNSYGVPFSTRYQWYLEKVEGPLKKEHVLPDERKLSFEEFANSLFFNQAQNPLYGDWMRKNRILIPRIAQEDFQSSALDQNRPRVSKDPTKATFSGRSTLQALRSVRKTDSFVSLDTFQSKTPSAKPPIGDGSLSGDGAPGMSGNTEQDQKPQRKKRSKPRDFGIGY